jgi:hypothetical protein
MGHVQWGALSTAEQEQGAPREELESAMDSVKAVQQ